MKCQFCNAQIPAGSRFCEFCGKSINGESNSNPNEIVFVSYGDVFSSSIKNNIVMGKAIKELSIGDFIMFDNIGYAIAEINDAPEHYCQTIAAGKICGIVLDKSIDKKALKKALKSCPVKDKYAPFYSAR